jgi:rhodanese-related sulfurtransferase
MANPRFKQIVDEAKQKIAQVTPTEASQKQQQGAILIDVRETEDFAKEHARGALHLSRGTIEWKIEETIPDTAAPILCYCGGGSRSALVAESLQRMGYTNVASVAGGFKAWKEAGLPVEQ